MKTLTDSSNWIKQAEILIKKFEKDHSKTYIRKEREYYALFEIGCFLKLIQAYKNKKFTIKAIHSSGSGDVFRYLTTPNGNPDNFSYIKLSKENEIFYIRQQVRIVQSKNERIYFTPDITVMHGNTKIKKKNNEQYANNKRAFFYIKSNDVVAAHECKSLEPFPELFASFLGMFILAHDWATLQKINPNKNNPHLAPTLFIGGQARGLHFDMIKAYQEEYPLNIITNIYSGFEKIMAGNFIEAPDVNHPTTEFSPFEEEINHAKTSAVAKLQQPEVGDVPF